MHRTSLRPSAVLALAFFAAPLGAACDDDKSSGNGTVTASQIYETMAAAYCDVLRTCDTGPTSDLAIFAVLARATSASTCRTFVAGSFGGENGYDIEAAVAAGKVSFDSAKLNACTAAVRARCTVGDLPECRDVFSGTIAIDAPCAHSEECVAGAWCDPTGGDSCGGGTCKARVEVGGDCISSQACLNTTGPTECNFSGGTGKCVTISFEKDAADGADCGVIAANGNARHVTCAKGSVCSYEGDDDQQTCVKTLEKGAACSVEGESAPCAVGEFCIPTSETTAKCTTPKVVTQVGGTCALGGAEPAACSIMDRLTCIEGKCTKLGDGSIGAICESDIEINTTCNSDGNCVDHHCVAKADNDANCSQDDDCKSDFCDFQSNTCKANTCL